MSKVSEEIYTLRNAQADERAWFRHLAESEEVWRVLKSSLGIFGRFRKVYISET